MDAEKEPPSKEDSLYPDSTVVSTNWDKDSPICQCWRDDIIIFPSCLSLLSGCVAAIGIIGER